MASMATPTNSKLESEVAQALDLSMIRYSRVFEDHRLSSRALRIQREDVVVCITSSGDNVLNMLLDEPKKMVAIDMSPAQNAILELKLVAIGHLSYEDYLLLLGEMEDSQQKRLTIYEGVKQYLPAYAKEYWDAHSNVLESGLCTCGRLDKYVAAFHNDHLPKVVSNEQIDELFAAKSLEEQNTLFQQLPLEKLKELYMWYTGKEQLQKHGRSEAQMKYVELSDGSVGAYFWRRFCETCQNVPIWENFYLSWWLRGQRDFHPDSNPAFAPAFLTREGFLKLRNLVDKVEVYNGTLESYLTQTSTPRINKASLSNIFEYMSEEDSEAVFAAVADHMVPGGRLVFWELLAPRVPSPALEGKITLLRDLSADFHKQDRVWWWSAFHVAEVK